MKAQRAVDNSLRRLRRWAWWMLPIMVIGPQTSFALAFVAPLWALLVGMTVAVIIGSCAVIVLVQFIDELFSSAPEEQSRDNAVEESCLLGYRDDRSQCDHERRSNSVEHSSFGRG